jgi:hypothetical protein
VHAQKGGADHGKKNSATNGWAEERICETWCAGIDPDHPALIEAEEYERWNAWLLDEGHEASRNPSNTRDERSPSIPQGLLSWLRGAT